MKKLLVSLAILSLGFGFFTLDLESTPWLIASLLAYSLPLFALVFKNPYFKVYSAWLGVFLVLQSIFSYYFIQKYHHLTPNFSELIEVQGDALPGISGRQKITTDSFGYRSTKQIQYKKKEGIRIFTLGASTTESILLDDHKTWSHLLQENLEKKWSSPIQVINSAVSGIRMPHVLDNFKKSLSYKPDIVIFLIGVNDWNKDIVTHFDTTSKNLHLFYHRFGLEYYEMQKLYLRNTLFGLASIQVKNLVLAPSRPSVQSVSPRIERGEYYSSQNNTLNKADKRDYTPSQLDPEYEKYLEKTLKLCHQKKVQCVFLTQPNIYKSHVPTKALQYLWMTPPNAPYTLSLESMTKIAAFYNDKLKEKVSLSGLKLCDLDAAIEPTLENFFDDVHFNEMGSKNVAKYIAECLSSNP